MKVILTADVKSLGKKGEIVDVSDGYARNMLLPKKLGVEANAKNINDLKLQKANEDKVAKRSWSRPEPWQLISLRSPSPFPSKSVRAARPSVLFPARRSPRQPRRRSIWSLTRRKSSFRARSVLWV